MQKWERWLTFLTNIGVIAGLALLAVEVSQNSEALRFSAVRESTSANVEIIVNQMTPEIGRVLVKAYDNEQLTPDEWVMVEGYLMPALLVLQDDYLDYLNGVFPPERWRARHAYLRTLIFPDAVRTWWSTFRPMYTQEFQALVDAETAALPDAPKYSDLIRGQPLPPSN